MPEFNPGSFALPVRADRVERSMTQESNWLDDLVEQLDDTIAMVESELAHDSALPRASKSEIDVDGLGVLSLPPEDYDWSNLSQG